MPEETANALRDGWLYTGDVCYLGEGGYLYIVDRVKDMIVTGGENVFTTEVENAIISQEAVLDVAVIGIPHEEWGEAVHAIVVRHIGQQVKERGTDRALPGVHCRLQIAQEREFPRRALPLSTAGKVLKSELRKPFWEWRERQVN